MSTDKMMIRGEKNLTIAGLKIKIANVQDIADRALRAFNDPDLVVDVRYETSRRETILFVERPASEHDRAELQLLCEQAIATRGEMEDEIRLLQEKKEGV